MIDTDYLSPDGKLRFIVRSPDGDVTLGFEGYPWHTHGDLLATSAAGESVASFWASRSPESAAESVAEHTMQFICDLIAGKLMIAVESVSGITRDIWITEDPGRDLRRCLPEEVVEFRLWDGTGVQIGALDR